jgi:hypothetical protein
MNYGTIVGPEKELSYSSSITLNGKLVSDNVCLNFDDCASNITFMGITSGSNLMYFFSGMLGLHPLTYDNSTSFVRKFKDQGIIDNLIVSL